MRLQEFSIDDHELVEALLSDPAVMADLGGVLTREKIAQAHKNYVDMAETEEGWIMKIMPDESTDAAGLVFLWDRPWGEETITEVGAQVLAGHQRKGSAAAALKALIARAKAEERCKGVHAFPPAGSEAGQALCASLGFRKLERCEVPFAGKPVRCVHWRLDF